jgi:translation initiation factor RLI1
MPAEADDLIQIQDQFYILASSTRIDDRTHVLKHGDSMAVLDRFGDVAPVGFGELGLYCTMTAPASSRGWGSRSAGIVPCCSPRR